MDTQPNQPQKGGNNALWIVLVIVILAIAVYGIYAFVSGNTNNANTTSNINSAVTTNTAMNTNSAVNVNNNVNAVVNSNTNTSTNTNIDTSGWKPYNDSEYQFAIKYPSAWTYQISGTPNNNSDPYKITFNTQRSELAYLPSITIKENLSLDQEIQNINQSDPPYSKVDSITDITIGTISAKRLLVDSAIGLVFEESVVIRGTTTYIFYSLENDREFESLVSTFSENKSVSR